MEPWHFCTLGKDEWAKIEILLLFSEYFHIWILINEWYFVLCMSSNEREGQKERHSAPAFVIHPIGSSTEVLFHALCYYILSARVCKLRLLSEAKREWPWFWRSRNRRSTSSAGGRLKKERERGGGSALPADEWTSNERTVYGGTTNEEEREPACATLSFNPRQ